MTQPPISGPDTDDVKAMAELMAWLRKAKRDEIVFTLEGRKAVIRPDYILAEHVDLLDRLSAQAQPSVLAEMVMVPVEPTDEMLHAGATRAKSDDSLMQQAPSYFGEARNIYKAMLSAAPKVQPLPVPAGDVREALTTARELLAEDREVAHDSFKIPNTDPVRYDSEESAIEIAWSYCAIGLIDRALASTDPAPRGTRGKEESVQQRPQNEESRVADTSCTKSASRGDA